MRIVSSSRSETAIGHVGNGCRRCRMGTFLVYYVVTTLLILLSKSTTYSWTTTPPPSSTNTRLSKASSYIRPPSEDQKHSYGDHSVEDTCSSLSPTNNIQHYDRRRVLSSTVGSTIMTFLTASAVATTTTNTLFTPLPAWALVKGVAPPPTPSKKGDKPKCTNVEECQALAEQREMEQRRMEEAGPPPLVTAGGVKYRDLDDGTVDGQSARMGDLVSVYFKVLKLGKRSYDGLSGEGTVVFSRGYGLEDDEDKAGVKSFKAIVGSKSNIAAFNEAIIGMKVDGIRRFAVLPQKGWEKATASCDGGPGGSGAGGDLKTDYVVVPTATMVQQEACFDTMKLPFPTTYAEQRRMAQRFDQSLIMEVQLVDVQKGDFKDVIL